MATDSSCPETGYNIHDTLFMPRRFPLARAQQSPNSPNLCLSLVSSRLCDSRDTKRPLSAIRSPPRTHLEWTTISSSSSPFHTVLSFRHKFTFAVSIGLFSMSSIVGTWRKVLPGISPVTGFPKLDPTHTFSPNILFFLWGKGNICSFVECVGLTYTNSSPNFQMFCKYFSVQSMSLLCQNLKKAKIKSTLCSTTQRVKMRFLSHKIPLEIYSFFSKRNLSNYKRLKIAKIFKRISSNNIILNWTFRANSLVSRIWQLKCISEIGIKDRGYKSRTRCVTADKRRFPWNWSLWWTWYTDTICRG